MAYLLARGSAVEWLRGNRDMSCLEKRLRLRYSDLEASRARLECHQEELSRLTKPLQLAVWSQDNRRPSAIVQSHTLTTQSGWYPAVCIAPGIYCSTPEFTFLQMARLLDEEALRFLGMELCGRYGIADERLFLRRQACTSEMLRSTATEERGVHGRQRALAVAPLVLEGAASPMEVALALILCTPRERGGFGLPAPELNHALPVGGTARGLWDDGSITPDLLWEPIKLVVEYDSNLHHTASNRIARDARRRDVLEELGYRVITVTDRQMRNHLELTRIAGIVAARLERDITPTSSELGRMLDFEQRMRHLATHPLELCAFPKPSRAIVHSWHVRQR